MTQGARGTSRVQSRNSISFRGLVPAATSVMTTSFQNMLALGAARRDTPVQEMLALGSGPRRSGSTAVLRFDRVEQRGRNRPRDGHTLVGFEGLDGSAHGQRITTVRSACTITE